MAKDLLTIREMCDAFGVTPRALRFYESKELLAPRREGMRRWFTRRDRARLKLILRGKRFGFSLEAIRRLLDLYESREGEAGQISLAQEIGSARLEEMQAQRESLDAAIDELREQLRWGEKMMAQTDRRAG